MPVRNALPFLDESVRSILDQTYADFEFVILDDGSTDGSGDALRGWARRDARIRLHHSRGRLGLSGSANLVVSHARAPLVARMDADDVAHPERLARQLEVMRARPDVNLVGTLFHGIDACGRRVRPRDRSRVLRRTLFPPFPHGSVMFRREAFDEVGGYREGCGGWEDQEMFLRMAERGRVAVIPDALYSYRYHLGCSTLSGPDALVGRDSLQRRCLAERRAGRDYAHLLSGARADEARLPPGSGAYLTAGAMRLWAGHPPAVWRQILRSARSERNAAAMMALVWAAWGGVSPRSLRAFMRGLIRARDLWAGTRLEDGRACEWRLE